MMNECIGGAANSNIYGHSEGGPMQIFFYKLCHLLKAPAIVIFVFDGSERPSLKRGTKKNTAKVPWWTEPCRLLIQSFGFISIQVGVYVAYPP
jgi:hypothetical protein